MFNAPNIVAMGMMPLSMLMAAMFFTSIEFSFRDCFAIEDQAAPP